MRYFGFGFTLAGLLTILHMKVKTLDLPDGLAFTQHWDGWLIGLGLLIIGLALVLKDDRRT